MIRKIAIIILFFVGLQVYGQHKDALIKVTDQLYMVSGHGGNVSFLVTDDGVLVVDAGSGKGSGHAIIEHVKSVTDQPVKYVVLTHYHYDHSFGACAFPEDVVVVGHKNIIHNLKTFGQKGLDDYREGSLKPWVKKLGAEMDSLKNSGDEQWQEVEKKYQAAQKQLEAANQIVIVYPDITFEDEKTICLGPDTIKLIHPGNTHTDGNILVSFVNQKALATGDFFFNGYMPYIDFNANSNTENWINQVNVYTNGEYEYVIPGHGKLANANELKKQATYLTVLREKIELLIGENKTFEEIQKEVKMPEYSHYEFQYTLGSEIEAIYKELTKQE